MVVRRCRFACARTTASDRFYTLLSTGNPFIVLYVWRQGASGGVRGTATDCGWNCDITDPFSICCVLRGTSSSVAVTSTYRYLLRFVCLGGGGGGGGGGFGGGGGGGREGGGGGGGVARGCGVCVVGGVGGLWGGGGGGGDGRVCEWRRDVSLDQGSVVSVCSRRLSAVASAVRVLLAKSTTRRGSEGSALLLVFLPLPGV